MRPYNPELTVDELIATLKRTSLPSVIIEGRDDFIIYRRLETLYKNQGISVIGAGGRDKVLQVFLRRAEIGDNVKIAFVVDRDSWIYNSVPDEYVDNNVFVTSGYSIENDAIVDGNLEGYMDDRERSIYEVEITKFLQWYALATSRFLTGADEKISRHPNEVLNPTVFPRITSMAEGEDYPSAFFETLKRNYLTQLRGKSLLALIMRQLSYGGRMVCHHSDHLMDVVAHNTGDLITNLFNRIGIHFGYNGTPNLDEVL